MTDIAQVARLLCGNEDHWPQVPAVARVEWPGGRFKPNTACADCLELLLSLYVMRSPSHPLRRHDRR